RGSHLILRHFQYRRIARVLPQLVKVGEMSAGPIQEKTEHLKKEVLQCHPFAALLKAAKLLQQQRQNGDRLQILDEQSYSASTRQRIVGDFDTLDPVGRVSRHKQLMGASLIPECSSPRLFVKCLSLWTVFAYSPTQSGERHSVGGRGVCSILNKSTRCALTPTSYDQN